MNKIAIFFLLSVLLSFSVNAQLCKRNVVDCKGICGRMTDADADGICDFSPRSADSPIPVTIQNEVNTDTTGQTEQSTETAIDQTNDHKKLNAEEVTINSKTIDKQTNKLEKQDLNNKKPADLVNETEAIDSTAELDEWGDAIEKVKTTAPVITTENSSVYPLIEISALTLVLYLITWLLAKFKVFKISVHRKIWNTVLLITFLMSGILGLILVFQINYNILDDWYMTFLELHVDFGISMALISIFHVLWHTKYFLTMFKKRKSVN